MLTDALGWLDCRRVATLPLDSRTLIIGVALYDVSAGVAAGPLLHGDGRYHRLESPPPAGRTDRLGRPKASVRHRKPEGGDVMKKIQVRKPGSVRLTARANYCYGCCCCVRAL